MTNLNLSRSQQVELYFNQDRLYTASYEQVTEKAKQLVSSEIYNNASALVTYALEGNYDEYPNMVYIRDYESTIEDIASNSDIENLQLDSYELAKQSLDSDPDSFEWIESEIYEYWICSEYLCELINALFPERPRCEIDFFNLSIFCRTEIGNALSYDGVIREVAKFLLWLEHSRKG